MKKIPLAFKNRSLITLFSIFFLSLFFITIYNVSFGYTQGKKNLPKNQHSQSDKMISIDFNDVDIHLFIKFISEITGKNFIVDQGVKAKVTIISPSKISVQEAYKVFESVLEIHGYSAIEAGEIVKIIPAFNSSSRNVETKLKYENDAPEDKTVTQLVPLKYADPLEIKRLFSPLISKTSSMVAYPDTNMLIITDYYSNITRLLKIIRSIDIAGVGNEITIIPLKYADATELVKNLEIVFEVKKSKNDKSDKTSFVADERTNTIIIMASTSETERITKLIDILDKETPKGKEKVHVYYLEHATAESLVKVLNDLPTKNTKSQNQTPVFSGKINITADKATNSLIIMADKDDYKILEGVIKNLDIPRSMVYIECLIMEVNVNKDFNIGTEWIAGKDTDLGDYNGVYGGGFSGGSSKGDSGYDTLSLLSKGVAPLPAGFSMGIFSENVQIGDLLFPNLGAVIQAYKKDKDVNILSTPQILTTDNEEATIYVGKNVPYLTKAATGDTNYNNYEYKDVGMTLKITPQISKDRLIRLDIEQEITKLEDITTTFQPTTLKRTIDTTVIVNDGNTVVIGGLIDDSFSSTEYKVPCLGNIPYLKLLFSSSARAHEKTNLFFFMTPRVIQSPLEAKKIYEQKQQHIDTIKNGNIKLYDQDKSHKTEKKDKSKQKEKQR